MFNVGLIRKLGVVFTFACITFLTDNETMFCPNDNMDMHQVKIESHYGQPIILEQCKGCGGIWFDESELFSAKQGEARNIDSLDSDILRKPSEIKRFILTCPRDQAELFIFDDRYFPKGIILERCPNCSGIWLNRGDFARFQKAREELQGPKVKDYDDKEMEEEIEHILTLHKDGDTTHTLGNLGRFLSTPIDRNTLLPFDSSESQPEAENTASLALNILMLVLRALILRS